MSTRRTIPSSSAARGPTIRPLVLLLAVLGATVARPAHAEEVEDQLGLVESAITAQRAQVTAVEQRLAAAAGTLDATRAGERFQAAVYQALLGHHEQAAEQFFVLVASGVLEQEGLQSEAEFYLGESLHELGYDDMAQDQYRAIVARPGDPFRVDAVRRLLEIYAGDPDPSKFDAVFEREIVRGGVKPNDLIVYSLGKALRAKGEPARAKAYLGGLSAKSPYWARAHYQIGVMLVEQGDEAALQEAVGVFQEIGLFTPKTDDDRRVRDLALLALGRLNDHLGHPKEAIDAYLRIPEDSPYRADQLHELVWIHIGQKAPGAALETVDKFLAAFPDHPVAAELRLVRGHLQFDMGDPERALGTYDEVAKAYTPVRDRFRALAVEAGDEHGFVERVLTSFDTTEPTEPTEPTDRADGTEAPQAGKPSPDAVTEAPAVSDALDEHLPGYARAVMTQDPAFRRVRALWTEARWTAGALDAADHLVDELRGALAGTGSEDLIESARFSAVDGRVTMLDQRLRIAAAEQSWLLERIPAQAAALGDLRGRREGLDGELRGIAQQVEGVRAAIDARLAAQDASRHGEVDARIASLSTQLGALPEDDPSRPEIEAAIASAKSQQSTLGASEGPIAGLDDLVTLVDREVPRLAVAVGDLERGLRAVRNAAGIDAIDPTAARFDAVRAEIAGASARLDRIARVLATIRPDELAAVHGVFAREASAVADERGDLLGRQQVLDAVASDVVRGDLVRLADLFGDRVLDAEMGAVNVHWTRWVQAGEERKATADARAKAMAEIDREYRLLEQKLGK